MILTRGTIEDAKATEHERSITSALQEAGFCTYWFSTQHRDHATGAINRYSAEAQVQRYYERRYDSVLVEGLKDALGDKSPTCEKKFIVLHTMGNHFSFKNRYPDDFSPFGQTTEERSAHQEMIDEYDNTVAFMDLVLSDVIREADRQPGLAAVFYVADHAEDLMDDERQNFGHLIPTASNLAVPMFFWSSSRYNERFPERVQAAKANASRLLNTRSVFYSLLQMAGTDIGDPQLRALSVFSPSPEAYPRMVMLQEGFANYDERQW